MNFGIFFISSIYLDINIMYIDMTDREEYNLYRSLQNEGKTIREIAAITNSNVNHVRYCLKSFYQEILDRKDAKTMIDEEFEKLVLKILPECNSLNHICNRLGLRSVEGYYQKIKKIIEKNNADTSHFGTIKRCKGDTINEIPDDEYFKDNVQRAGTALLKRLLGHGYKERKCENPNCGLSEWNNQPIPLEVHHINGKHDDNRLENLQLLCRNCHAQTDSFCKKDKFNKKDKIKESIIKNNVETNENLSIRTTSEEKYNFCLNCKKKISKKLTYCSQKCYNEYKKKKFSIEEIREAFLKAKSILGAAKLLSISDNGLKKMCKRLNIFEEMRYICGM